MNQKIPIKLKIKKMRKQNKVLLLFNKQYKNNTNGKFNTRKNK